VAPEEDERDAAPLPDDGVAMCSFNVFYPIGIRAKHRNEVILAFHCCDGDRISPHPAGYTTANFKGGLETGR